MTKGDILSPQPRKTEGKWWWVKGCVNRRHQMEGHTLVTRLCVRSKHGSFKVMTLEILMVLCEMIVDTDVKTFQNHKITWGKNKTKLQTPVPGRVTVGLPDQNNQQATRYSQINDLGEKWCLLQALRWLMGKDMLCTEVNGVVKQDALCRAIK